MSIFSVPIEISDLERRRSERIDAWVETGAFYSALLDHAPHSALLATKV